MLKFTSYSSHDNYVVTSTNLDSRSFRSHDELTKNLGRSSSRSSYCARRRAFSRASSIVYCNKDFLNTFLTLTYKNQHHDYKKILNDLKNHFSKKKINYIGVVETHKSGNFHIHLLTTDLPNVVSLRPGKFSWSDWDSLGFSDVKFISQTDEKFRVELYIFKYMMKSEKIGGRYVLSSRGLKVRYNSYSHGILPKPIIQERPIDFSTYNIYTGSDYCLTVGKDYYERQQTYEKINSKRSSTRKRQLRGL